MALESWAAYTQEALSRERAAGEARFKCFASSLAHCGSLTPFSPEHLRRARTMGLDWTTPQDVPLAQGAGGEPRRYNLMEVLDRTLDLWGTSPDNHEQPQLLPPDAPRHAVSCVIGMWVERMRIWLNATASIL